MLRAMERGRVMKDWRGVGFCRSEGRNPSTFFEPAA